LALGVVRDDTARGWWVVGTGTGTGQREVRGSVRHSGAIGRHDRLGAGGERAEMGRGSDGPEWAKTMRSAW
jgi:hypothetical protein